jgi:hypothetical protein
MAGKMGAEVHFGVVGKACISKFVERCAVEGYIAVLADQVMNPCDERRA